MESNRRKRVATIALLVIAVFILSVFAVFVVAQGNTKAFEGDFPSKAPAEPSASKPAPSGAKAPSGGKTPDSSKPYSSWRLNFLDPPEAQLPSSTISGSTHLSGGLSNFIYSFFQDDVENYGWLNGLSSLKRDKWAMDMCEDMELRATEGMSLAVSASGKSQGVWMKAERAYIDPCLGITACTEIPIFIYKISGVVDGRDFNADHPLVFNVRFRQKKGYDKEIITDITGLKMTGADVVRFKNSIKLPPFKDSNLTRVAFTGARMGVVNSTKYFDEICVMLRVENSDLDALDNKLNMPDPEEYTWKGHKYALLCSVIPETGGYLKQDLKDHLTVDEGTTPPGMENLGEEDDYENYIEVDPSFY
jgi:hypothetical protein